MPRQSNNEQFEKDVEVLFGNRRKSPGNGKNRPPVTLVRLHLNSIQFPHGVASKSPELWTRMSRGKIGGSLLDILQRNGLNIAVGSLSDWSETAQYIRSIGGKSLKSSMMIAIPGRPVNLMLTRRKDPQTVFMFRSDGTLSGEDYPAGDNQFAVTCDISSSAEADQQQVTFRVVPQINTMQQKTRFVAENDAYTVKSFDKIESFYPLSFNLNLSTQQYLVIGPSSYASRQTSLGKHFFVEEDEGVLYETLLIITPEVVRGSRGSENGMKVPRRLELPRSSEPAATQPAE